MEKNYQIWHHRRCIFECFVRKQVLSNPLAQDVPLAEALKDAAPIF